MGGLINQKMWVATNFHWAEAHQRFRIRSQGVTAAVSVFVSSIKMKTNTETAMLSISDQKLSARWRCWSCEEYQTKLCEFLWIPSQNISWIVINYLHFRNNFCQKCVDILFSSNIIFATFKYKHKPPSISYNALQCNTVSRNQSSVSVGFCIGSN